MQRPTPLRTLELRNVGPISEAKLTFGDLTVLVGPQASGKSIALQTLKLVLDHGSIRTQLDRFGFHLSDASQLSELYFGEGLRALLRSPAYVAYQGRPTSAEAMLSSRRAQRPRLFYIPAQRAMSMRDGVTLPFTQFGAGDPFVLREFSESVHVLVQQFDRRDQLLFADKGLQEPIQNALLGGMSLGREIYPKSRFILSRGRLSLPFGVWSTGQREFVSLFLGLKWLFSGHGSRRDEIEWVVIEEPESGLHPRGIVAVLALVLDLLHHGYRVCLSTHSPQVLDLVWALGIAKERGGTQDDVLDLLDLGDNEQLREVAATALTKLFKVHYLERGKPARDISSLDPGSEDDAISHWGGLTSFAGRAGDIVARIVNRAEAQR